MSMLYSVDISVGIGLIISSSDTVRGPPVTHRLASLSVPLLVTVEELGDHAPLADYVSLGLLL